MYVGIDNYLLKSDLSLEKRSLKNGMVLENNFLNEASKKKEAENPYIIFTADLIYKVQKLRLNFCISH